MCIRCFSHLPLNLSCVCRCDHGFQFQIRPAASTRRIRMYLRVRPISLIKNWDAISMAEYYARCLVTTGVQLPRFLLNPPRSKDSEKRTKEPRGRGQQTKGENDIKRLIADCWSIREIIPKNERLRSNKYENGRAASGCKSDKKKNRN